MGGGLLNEVRRFLAGLEATQQELLELFDQKQTALRQARSEELLRLAQQEADLVDRLRGHVTQREKLLQQARSAGRPAEDLTRLIERIGGPEAETLTEPLQRVRRNSAALRRESWVQWMIAQRSYNQYSELLERIVHHGKRAAAYDRQPSGSGRGGTLLDASA